MCEQGLTFRVIYSSNIGDVSTFASGLVNPTAIVANLKENVYYVTNQSSNNISKLSSSGAYLPTKS